ncbi:T9SS type A sorting domain-containing protein [bacterium]|nr:T9SS type A sorting domain-containing protein [bacterium]
MTSRITAPYPNPFNSLVTVPVFPANPGFHHFTVYNLLGQVVSVDDIFVGEPTPFRFTWIPDALPSGTYVIKIEDNQRSIQKRVVFMK